MADGADSPQGMWERFASAFLPLHKKSTSVQICVPGGFGLSVGVLSRPFPLLFLAGTTGMLYICYLEDRGYFSRFHKIKSVVRSLKDELDNESVVARIWSSHWLVIIAYFGGVTIGGALTGHDQKSA